MTNYPTYKLGEIITDAIGGDWGKDPGIQDESYELAYCIRGAEYKNWADDNGSTAVLRKIKCTNLQKRQLKEGDIIVEISGGGPEQPVGRTEVITKKVMSNFKGSKVLCTNFLRLIRPNAELVDSVFLNHYLKYFYSTGEIIKYQAGSNNLRNLKFNDYLTLSIPLPPLPTQHAIVSRIESLFAELDKAVQHLRTAQQQIKTYRQAVLKVAFEECDSYEKITNCFDVTGGLTKNSQREKFSIKMPYLRVANVYYNRLDLSEIKEIGVQESEIKDKLLKKEDLLFVEGNGSKEQIGRVAVWDGSIENCLHQNHIIKGRPLGTMLSKFALYYFISDFGREQILKVASSTSGLYTLSTEKVRNLKVPSCSLTEQQRIVAEIESRLSQAEAVEASIEKALQQSEALRQSILKKAFEGELV